MKHEGTFYTEDGAFYSKDGMFNIGNGRKVYVVKAICDYFSKREFIRLLDESQYAKENGAGFYVAVYSEDLLESRGISRPFKGIVSDADRIFSLEAMDFVDGAFVIRNATEEAIGEALAVKIARQKNTEIYEPTTADLPKKYRIGYASGAFDCLHKGHIEHIRDMAKQCKRIIVAANSDRLIREYKHKECVIDEETRRSMLEHLRYVDIAIVTDEYDKLKAVSAVKNAMGSQFDAIFAGSDWQDSPNWNDFQVRLAELGIDVVFTERPKDGISTTKISRAIVQKKKKEEKPAEQVPSEGSTGAKKVKIIKRIKTPQGADFDDDSSDGR